MAGPPVQVREDRVEPLRTGGAAGERDGHARLNGQTRERSPTEKLLAEKSAIAVITVSLKSHPAKNASIYGDHSQLPQFQKMNKSQ